MSQSFDLRERPWIPVETLVGERRELSTREALREAHALRAISDESPLVVGALTRHLLAILHRAYDGPKSMREWSAIANAGRFDGARIDAYLDSDLARDRMDLFHPTRPFAQTRGLRARFEDFAQPADELELARSSWGGGRELFRHRPDAPQVTLSPARATRALLAHQAFVTGGLIRKPNEPTAATAAPLVRAGLVVLRGRSLFETLLANLLVYAPGDARPIAMGAERDVCAWEQAPPPEALPLAKEPKERPTGYLGLLTWLSRRVELLANEDGQITGFINAVYKGLDEDSPRDPMVTWRRDDERGLVPIGIDTERSFWRSSAALFEATRDESSRFLRPMTLDLVATPEALSVLPAEMMYSVEVVGISAEKSRVDAVRAERVHVLAKTLDDPDARTAIDESLSCAETSVRSLLFALRLYARIALSPGTRDPDPKDVDGFVRATGAKGAAWSALGVEFEQLLRELGGDPAAAAKRFAARVDDVIWRTFTDATASCDRTGGGLKARAKAESALRRDVPRRATKPVTNTTAPSAAAATQEAKP
jgi:CRISPR system Cascade subunit CasA